jgi:hypothetical protein
MYPMTNPVIGRENIIHGFVSLNFVTKSSECKKIAVMEPAIPLINKQIIIHLKNWCNGFIKE